MSHKYLIQNSQLNDFQNIDFIDHYKTKNYKYKGQRTIGVIYNPQFER